MSLYFLIPCKSLRHGKSRLAPIVSSADRRLLCARLLRNSLALALALQPVDKVSVITSDPEAKAIAEKHGVGTIDDGGTCLNEALRRGRASMIGQRDGDKAVIILPIDLAYATTGAIARAIRPDLDVALVPDEGHQGTNLLYIGPRAWPAFPFAFGPNSFLAHRSWAEQAGFRVAIIEEPLLAFDIDWPEDYVRWRYRR
jgi:2-phospho-L-lactate/phosphoenolpyruvate guanylyltransferase